MKFSLITPAKKRSRSGNRTTALRWANIFRNLGHRVDVAVEYDGRPADLMVALHAWRSAASIAAFREQYPKRPIVLALTGTDIYRFLASDPEPTLRSMDMADMLVCLHDLVHRTIPERFTDKLQVVYQSALPLARPRSPSKRNFDVCVVGHLRDEKDPLRTALAARDLPPASRLRVIHLGKAHDDVWVKRAQEEMVANPRYFWRGEVPGSAVRQTFVKSHLMVLSSIMEGGANVISEAAVAGVPIVASNIPGSVGLLGEDYPGYYPVQDTTALTELLRRAETDPTFLDQLIRHCTTRASLFSPDTERKRWQNLLAHLS